MAASADGLRNDKLLPRQIVNFTIGTTARTQAGREGYHLVRTLVLRLNFANTLARLSAKFVHRQKHLPQRFHCHQ